ncbi:prepilin-type N-terminal cleavage/methylation domain-containing protein [Neptunicella marina]|uniref:Prepilin-type N-terminal cleavage/methylation domain-containing protein n=1 Tax=Neptunicella marina TaxID=2125989 RepID=A0A8J6IUF1_9ALTE|nr:prepilin-type N-terminal cleavage/methylation domain-containing protein [Neptunicella marina]MBC3766112.1 prepilin-type N-terminal cleavage/methylation domain-containing protein [Neptunicella marina]
MHKSNGFTLIELIVVIIIVGILSVVVAARFQGKSGFAEYTWQKRGIAALRYVQLQAMQDTSATNSGACYRLNVDTTNNQFGLPPVADSCSDNIDINRHLASSSGNGEMDNDDVSISLSDNTSGIINGIGFNGLGQPVDAANNAICVSGCTMSFTDSLSANICIESQGFVHAC